MSSALQTLFGNQPGGQPSVNVAFNKHVAAVGKAAFGQSNGGKGKFGGGRGGKHRAPTSRSKRAGLTFPVGRVTRFLRKGRYAHRIGGSAPVYLCAVLEYLSAEILELAGNSSKDNKRRRITPRDLMKAVRNDEELHILLKDVTFASGGVMPHIHGALMRPSKKDIQAKKNQAVQKLMLAAETAEAKAVVNKVSAPTSIPLPTIPLPLPPSIVSAPVYAPTPIDQPLVLPPVMKKPEPSKRKEKTVEKKKKEKKPEKNDVTKTKAKTPKVKKLPQKRSVKTKNVDDNSSEDNTQAEVDMENLDGSPSDPMDTSENAQQDETLI